MNILDLVQETGLTTKREAVSHGGEYSSPCPFCKEGDDRFRIWPNRHNNDGSYTGGRYQCPRHCGKYGDAITFLREFSGLSYREACERLRVQPKECNSQRAIRQTPKAFIAQDPPTLWQEKGSAFVDWCHAQLLRNNNAIEIFEARGFTRDSIIRFHLGYCPEHFYRAREDWGLASKMKDDSRPSKHWLPMGLVIPTFAANNQVVRIKIRRTDWTPTDTLPKYVEVSGSKACPSVYGNTALPCVIIVESEFDALLIQQLAADILYCVALGGSSKPLDLHTDQLLRTAETLLFCPDFDEAGLAAWQRWQKMFKDIKRILTPDGKAPGDAHLMGIDLRAWILSALTPSIN